LHINLPNGVNVAAMTCAGGIFTWCQLRILAVR